MPSSFLTLAARIGLNFHAVSFAFGPALYFLGQNLLPGIDYYAQYSIGYPWLLHFVMGQSVERTIVIYTITIVLATWLFYAHLIYLLQDLYKSWNAAALVSLIPLILGFLYYCSCPDLFRAISNNLAISSADRLYGSCWVSGRKAKKLCADFGYCGRHRRVDLPRNRERNHYCLCGRRHASCRLSLANQDCYSARRVCHSLM